MQSRHAIIYALGFLVLGMVSLLYLGRNNIYKWVIQPRTPFLVQSAPPAPNYDAPADWAAWPDQSALAAQAPAIFFVAPNTAQQDHHAWNLKLTHAGGAHRMRQQILPNHAAPFASIGPIFAPYYRQAALYAMLNVRADSADALGLAYHDVAEAYAHFRRTIGPNRPYILVGMGQGALHVLRLLQQEHSADPLLVAAYLQDLTVLAGNHGPYPICATRNQAHCIIAYRVADGPNIDAEMANWDKRAVTHMAGKGYLVERARDKAICVNPLNGIQNGRASARDNLGSVAANGLEAGREPVRLPHATSANCSQSYLVVQWDRAANLKARWYDFGAVYKAPAYSLFYQALADDARARTNAWQQAQ